MFLFSESTYEYNAILFHYVLKIKSGKFDPVLSTLLSYCPLLSGCRSVIVSPFGEKQTGVQKHFVAINFWQKVAVGLRFINKSYQVCIIFKA